MTFTPTDESDLEWRFQRAAGELGLKSSFAGMVAQLQTGPVAISYRKPLEPDDKRLEAVARWNRVEFRLVRVHGLLDVPIAPGRVMSGAEALNVLIAAYSRPPPLGLLSYGRAAVLLLTDEHVLAAHGATKRRLDVADWLAGLHKTASKRAQLRAFVRRADERLLAAQEAFARTPRVRGRRAA